MAGKFVGIDWYQDAYTVLERIEDNLVPIEGFSEIYDAVRYVCKTYDHFDEIYIPDTLCEIATLVVRNENLKELSEYNY